MLWSKETAKLILASSREVVFLQDGRTKSESSERKFYFLEEERNRFPRGRKVPKTMTLAVRLAQLKESNYVLHRIASR